MPILPRPRFRFLAGLLGLAVAAIVSPAAAEVIEITNLAGQTIRAEVVDRTEDEVRIRREGDRRIFTIELATLDEASRERVAAVALALPVADAEMRTSVSQYGITWTFDKAYPAGQFINGDWWVVGPVKVVEVDPAPGKAASGGGITAKSRFGAVAFVPDDRMRNGSMIVEECGAQGYDSRNKSYEENLTVSFPVTLEPGQSLMSSISNEDPRVKNFAHELLWGGEKNAQLTLNTIAVLTCLDSPPPPDAFRPPYAGTWKPIFRESQLRWDLLKELDAPSSAPDWETVARWFQRPWIDHVRGWQYQHMNPNENCPSYGREWSRMASIGALMFHTDAPREVKREALIGYIQMGIDVGGLARAGRNWRADGGHYSGRKWPMVFAGLMLDAPELQRAPEGVSFQEDQQTYYGEGWAGQEPLWWMVNHTGARERYEHKDPSTWDKMDHKSESYRKCCTSSTWVGAALSARLMEAIPLWGHDAYFDYVDRWMAVPDPYAAGRGKHDRPDAEGKTHDKFVDDMWKAYRDRAPDQPYAGDNVMWVWDGGGKWVSNPRPGTVKAAEAYD